MSSNFLKGPVLINRGSLVPSSTKGAYRGELFIDTDGYLYGGYPSTTGDETGDNAFTSFSPVKVNISYPASSGTNWSFNLKTGEANVGKWNVAPNGLEAPEGVGATINRGKFTNNELEDSTIRRANISDVDLTNVKKLTLSSNGMYGESLPAASSIPEGSIFFLIRK